MLELSTLYNQLLEINYDALLVFAEFAGAYRRHFTDVKKALDDHREKSVELLDDFLSTVFSGALKSAVLTEEPGEALLLQIYSGYRATRFDLAMSEIKLRVLHCMVFATVGLMVSHSEIPQDTKLFLRRMSNALKNIQPLLTLPLPAEDVAEA